MFFKYRIWDENHKCFVDENNDLMMNMTIAEAGATDIFAIEYYGDSEIIKYSGVTDDKGEEIYEGDILKKIDVKSGNASQEISYGIIKKESETNNLIFEWHEFNEYCSAFRDPEVLPLKSARYYMVVGNKYENLELLKSEVESNE